MKKEILDKTTCIFTRIITLHSTEAFTVPAGANEPPGFTVSETSALYVLI